MANDNSRSKYFMVDRGCGALKLCNIKEYAKTTKGVHGQRNIRKRTATRKSTYLHLVGWVDAQ